MKKIPYCRWSLSNTHQLNKSNLFSFMINKILKKKCQNQSKLKLLKHKKKLYLCHSNKEKKGSKSFRLSSFFHFMER